MRDRNVAAEIEWWQYGAYIYCGHGASGNDMGSRTGGKRVERIYVKDDLMGVSWVANAKRVKVR
jgi:hypothetical protein